MAGPFQSRCIGPLRFGCIVPTAACRDESSRGRTFEQHNANCAYRDRADAVLGRRSFDSFCSRPRHIYSFHFLVQSLTIRVTWIKCFAPEKRTSDVPVSAHSDHEFERGFPRFARSTPSAETWGRSSFNRWLLSTPRRECDQVSTSRQVPPRFRSRFSSGKKLFNEPQHHKLRILKSLRLPSRRLARGLHFS